MQISILGVEYRHFDIKDNLDFDFLSNLSVIERHYKDILKRGIININLNNGFINFVKI